MATDNLRSMALSPQPLDRLTTPLYSQAEVARILGARQSTFQRWTRGYTTGRGTKMPPLVFGVREGRGYSVPFLSLAEAYVVRTLLATGVSMPHIRDTVTALRDSLGVEYALASRQLKTDGAVILWEHEKERGDDSPLVVFANGQAVFRDTVAERLQTITYSDGYAGRLAIRLGRAAAVDVNPMRNFGQPTLAGTGVRVSDIVGRLNAGETARSVASDYEIPERAVRSLLKLAA